MVDLSTEKSCMTDFRPEKYTIDQTVEKSVWWILALENLYGGSCHSKVCVNLWWILVLKSLYGGS